MTEVSYNATAATSVGYSVEPVFEGCVALNTLRIGDNVTSIPANAFKTVTSLTSIYALPENPPTLQYGTFEQSLTTTGINVYVPFMARDDYEWATYWGTIFSPRMVNSDPQYVVTPDSGYPYLESLSEITIDVKCATNCTCTNDLTKVSITLGSGATVAATEIVKESSLCFKIFFPEITGPETVSIKLDAGLFTGATGTGLTGSRVNSDVITASYELIGNDISNIPMDIVANDAMKGLEKFEQFQIAAADKDYTLARNSKCTNAATLVKGSIVVNLTDGENGALVVPADANLTETGVYTLNIPANYYIAAGEEKAYTSALTTYVALAPSAQTEMVDVKYTVNTLVDGVNGYVASHDFKAVKGEALEVAVDEMGEDWTLESVALDGTVMNKVGDNYVSATAVSAEGSNVEATYKFNYTIEDELVSGAEMVVSDEIKVAVTDEEVLVTGLTEGDVVKVYAVNGIHLSTFNGASETVLHITLPAGVYIVAVNHNGKVTAVKVAK